MEEKRREVAEAYPGKWRDKVKRMSDKQVLAIWYRLFEKPKIQMTPIYTWEEEIG